MCAIAGIIGHPHAAELVAQMTSAQSHRGPDGARIHPLTPIAAFGHNRLAILDLSDRGSQPMTSRDGRWTIVLNGEIFNYRELKARMPAIPWRSETDTEVLLEAVASWGIDRALESTVGMFGVALWDHRERALFIARDRLGEKPVTYFWDGKTFAFASELKALAPLHASRIHAPALDVYLALGYVPAPLAIFRDTHKLPPGHYARFKSGSLDIRRWWFPEDVSLQPAANVGDRREQLRSRIAEAVRLRLRADVSIGLALSGGIDSSILAAELTRQGSAPDAFTVIFDGDQSDLAPSQTVARKLGIRHEVIHAEVPRDRILETSAHYDEPFADSSSVACLALARAMQGRYKVLLMGDGGDEAFAGYRHYEFIAAKQALKAVAAAAGLRDGGRVSTIYVQSKTTFRAAERSGLLNGHGTGTTLNDLLTSDPFLRTARGGALKRALWSDRHLHLANGLTYKTDIAFAAHGMEGRAPLLDHRVLEWAQNLDDRDLVHGREKKVQLRYAYASELPPEILSRPKHGFGAPIARWLAGPLRECVEDILPCPLLEESLQQAQSGQRLWTLLTFALWAKQWRASW